MGSGRGRGQGEGEGEGVGGDERRRATHKPRTSKAFLQSAHSLLCLACSTSIYFNFIHTHRQCNRGQHMHVHNNNKIQQLSTSYYHMSEQTYVPRCPCYSDHAFFVQKDFQETFPQHDISSLVVGNLSLGCCFHRILCLGGRRDGQSEFKFSKVVSQL